MNKTEYHCSAYLSRIYKRLTNRKPPFESCCAVHDKYYKDENTIISRKIADIRMRQCVEKSGNPKIAYLMYITVRLFGWLYWKGNK